MLLYVSLCDSCGFSLQPHFWHILANGVLNNVFINMDQHGSKNGTMGYSICSRMAVKCLRSFLAIPYFDLF